MSRSITTRQDARSVWKECALCYLCGDPLPILYLEESPIQRDAPSVNRDHVPPETLFAPADRGDFPLLLRTHVRCNGHESPDDQKMAELFRLIWNQETDVDLEVLQLEWEKDGNGKATVSYWKEDDLRAIVFRWVRGFHYALYGEVLSKMAKRSTLLPFLELRPEGICQPLQHHFDISRYIRRQRALSSLDRITAYNGRMKYECVWHKDGATAKCFFALDVNGWSVFSSSKAGPYRSCLGSYECRDVPTEASTLSSLFFPDAEPTLDLFPDLRARYIGPETIRKRVSFRGGDFPPVGEEP